MPKLYVVNCTGQNRQVNYRLDYTVDDQGRRTSERLVPYKTQAIAARQQMQFGSDWHPLQVQDIVQQLEESCGAVHADKVRTAKNIGVVKMIWQQDRPISRAILEDVIAHNMGLLTDQGAERRENLAIAADSNLTSLIGQEAPKMELEFEQVEEDPDLPGRLTEGLRVKHAAAPSPPKRERTRRAA